MTGWEALVGRWESMTMPANILNLPCYKVVGIQENKRGYRIDVETLHAPTSCPHCQSGNLVGFGRRKQCKQ